MADALSVLIPSRNEELLQKTIDSILSAAVEEVEIIAVLDGYWPVPPIQDHPNVVLIHYSQPVGQRAAVNQAARVAKGKYIMKLDAHCSVGPGFDKILKEDCQYDWTMVPRMYTLDVVEWKPKKNKRTDYMYISGPNHKNGDGKPYGLRAMYYGNWGGASTQRPSNDAQIDETMCCMGPGWFMHKDRFWELGGMDEGHGGWGQMGVEVACKAWLSGGKLMVNKKTWFAHWFRGGGVPDGFKSGFPYQISGGDVERAREYSKDLWLNQKWPQQVRSIYWLVDHFQAPTWDKQVDLSVVIPSWKDPLLHKTVQDILTNFETDFEIVPVIDGYELSEPLPDDPRVRPVFLKQNGGMRNAINEGVKASRGKYIMRADEHCAFCPGFDRIVLADIKPDEIVVTRRKQLDPVRWEVMPEHGEIGYEKLSIARNPLKFTGRRWPERDKERAGIMVDETMAMQGSMWIMPKAWWTRVIGALQTEGYGPHYQDSVEMLFKTWKAGGHLMLNKHAWYAHRHKSFNRTHNYPGDKARWEWKYALLKHYDEYLEVIKRWEEYQEVAKRWEEGACS